MLQWCLNSRRGRERRRGERCDVVSLQPTPRLILAAIAHERKRGSRRPASASFARGCKVSNHGQCRLVGSIPNFTIYKKSQLIFYVKHAQLAPKISVVLNYCIWKSFMHSSFKSIKNSPRFTALDHDLHPLREKTGSRKLQAQTTTAGSPRKMSS
jgi:hypothetical protein